jgi:ribosome-binding factor A
VDLKPAKHHRDRVVETLREELRELIAYELEDPRIDGVEVISVVPDGSLKQVHVNIVRHTGSVAEAVEALQHAKGFLKSQLISRLEMRRVPELYFNPAADLGPAGRVESLLRRVRRGRPRG